MSLELLYDPDNGNYWWCEIDCPVAEPVQIVTEDRKHKASAVKAGVRKPRATKPKVEKVENPLLSALLFLGIPLKKNGDLQETHFAVANGFAYAHNETLTVGCPIQMDMTAVVNHGQLVEALKRAVGATALTQVSESTLSVVDAGGMRVVVPGAPTHLFRVDMPDPNIAAINDRLRAALVAAATFAADLTGRPEIDGVLLQGQTCVGTNGHAMVEAFHGIDLPSSLHISVKFVKAVAKCKKVLTGFGYSDKSVTFWFEDGSFIRTARYEAEYAKYAVAFNGQGGKSYDLKPEFFSAIKRLLPFTKDGHGHIYFVDGYISANRDVSDSSSYKLGELPLLGFNGNYLLAVKDWCQNAYFDVETTKFWFNDNSVRGVIMGLELTQPKKLAQQESKPYVDQNGDEWDDDIPF